MLTFKVESPRHILRPLQEHIQPLIVRPINKRIQHPIKLRLRLLLLPSQPKLLRPIPVVRPVVRNLTPTQPGRVLTLHYADGVVYEVAVGACVGGSVGGECVVEEEECAVVCEWYGVGLRRHRASLVRVGRSCCLGGIWAWKHRGQCEWRASRRTTRIGRRRGLSAEAGMRRVRTCWGTTMTLARARMSSVGRVRSARSRLTRAGRKRFVDDAMATSKQVTKQ